MIRGQAPAGPCAGWTGGAVNARPWGSWRFPFGKPTSFFGPSPAEGGVERARGAWVEWDEAVLRGVPVQQLLREATDEHLVELATTGEPTRRKYELNLVMVELSNRIQRLRREIQHVRSVAETHLAATQARTERGARLLQRALPILPRPIREAAEALVTEGEASIKAVREALAQLEDHAFEHARGGKDP